MNLLLGFYYYLFFLLHILIKNIFISLVATIQTYRPDIIFDSKFNENIHQQPIPLRPPLDLFTGIFILSLFIYLFILNLLFYCINKLTEHTVPGVGELMLPSFPNQTYEPNLW